MAQQVTNNNSSLLDLLSQSGTTAGVDAADNSAATQFDAIYNKSLEAAKSVDKSKSVNNQSVYTYSTTSTKTDTKQTVETNNTKTANTAETSLSENTETSVDTDKVVENTTQTDSSTDETTDTAEVETEIDTDMSISDATDIVSKYAYLDEVVQSIDEDNADITDEVDTETLDNVDETIPVDDTLSEGVEVLDSQSELTPDIEIQSDDTQNIINLASQAAAVSVNNTEITADTDTLAEDTVTVNVSENITDGTDIDTQSTKNDKELISQKMVDELNVTIEEVSDDTIQVESTDSTLMDSTEQAVKYSIDNYSKEEPAVVTDKPISTTESKEPVVDETLEVKEDISLEDVTEQTEDLIANSDDIKNEEVKSTTDTVETEEIAEPEVQITDESEETSSEENSSSNNENTNDKKDEMKKEALTSNDMFDDIPDVDVDVASVEPKISNVNTSDVSASKPHIAGVSQSVGSQSTASPTFQTANVTKEDVIAQIHSKLQALNSTTNTKLTMVLNPESLGKVSVQLTNGKDGMTAEMMVASQSVKDLLDSNISNLKETLSAQGVQVNDVTVKVSNTENNAEMDYTEQEGSESNAQDHKNQEGQDKDNNEFEKLFSMNTQEEQENDIN